MPDSSVWRIASTMPVINCSREALEQIRRSAVSGLLALPRVGLGIGGFLLGTRGTDETKVMDWLPIPCSHAQGPGFSLTPEEIEHARELAAGSSPLSVVGFCFSKTRGSMEPGATDLSLVESLCPEPWQITALIRPSTVEPSRIAIFVKDAQGTPVRQTEETLEPFEVKAAAPAEPAPEPRNAATAVKAAAASADAVPQGPVAEPPKPAAPPAEKTPVRETVRPAVIRTEPKVPLAFPEFLRQPPPRSNGWRKWAVISTSVVAGAIGAYSLRDKLSPPAPFNMTSVETNGHLTIRWNPDAVRGIDSGSITLNDGAGPRIIQLTRQQLTAGAFQYDPKPGRVTALLKAGDREAVSTFTPSVP
ncbi:MAG TPA: hypothetical protein VHB50_21405 [Bryobacteraceae bacterium]|nr:hypothetical protein [Bryobacteraceae bacterium]